MTTIVAIQSEPIGDKTNNFRGRGLKKSMSFGKLSGHSRKTSRSPVRRGLKKSVSFKGLMSKTSKQDIGKEKSNQDNECNSSSNMTDISSTSTNEVYRTITQTEYFHEVTVDNGLVIVHFFEKESPGG